LNEDGKDPDERDRLMILVMVGTNAAAQSFRREVGIRSRSHCLFGSEFSRADTSASEADLKDEKMELSEGGAGVVSQLEERGVSSDGEFSGDSEGRLRRREETLLEKKVQKESAIREGERQLGKGEVELRCSKLLMVFHSFRGLPMLD